MGKNEVQAMRLRLEALYNKLEYGYNNSVDEVILDLQEIKDLKEFMDVWLWS